MEGRQSCPWRTNGFNDVATFEYPVKQGANIHAGDDYALRWATRESYLEIVKYLTKQGADIHLYNDLEYQKYVGLTVGQIERKYPDNEVRGFVAKKLNEQFSSNYTEKDLKKNIIVVFIKLKT